MIMMKKVFLAILPTLMVLSSCGAAPKANKEIFVEDTLAHEEVFGESVQMVKETVERKPNGIDEFIESGRPSLGIQTATYQGKFSIRFVAAINIASGDLGATTPVWTRTIYKADGSVAKSSEGLNVQTVYTSLKNGESTISIQDFNDANGTNYDYFAVYTILNIDDSTRGDYFINAKLTVGDKESKVLATSVNQSKQLTFEDSSNGFFLGGTFGGNKKELFADYPTRNENQASFTYNFAAGDSFYLVKRTDSSFQMFNSDCFGDVRGHFVSGTNKLISVKDAGNMRLYFNNSSLLYSSDSFTPSSTGLYIRGELNGWLNGGLDADYELLSDNNDSQGVIYNIYLPKGDFKIGNENWSSQWGYADGYHNCRIEGNAASNFSGSTDSGDQNIYCSTAGNYNIMLKNNHKIFIWNA